MFISVYKLDIENPEVCRALLDTSVLHKHILDIFDAPREKYNVLFGVYDGYLLVKSDIKPIYDTVFGPAQTIDMSDKISEWKEGDTFNFMIMTSPYRQGFKPDSRKKIRHYIKDETKRLQWLREKFSDRGAEIITVKEISKENKLMGSKENNLTGGKVTVTTWKYQGMLQISNLEKFIHLYSEGLGRQKAFGNGMVVLS